MRTPLTSGDREKLAEFALTFRCTRCGAKPGNPCIYKGFKGFSMHAARLETAKATQQDRRSKYGIKKGTPIEDLSPLGARSVTVYELRKIGFWKP
jgi:hypothetical protein